MEQQCEKGETSGEALKQRGKKKQSSNLMDSCRETENLSPPPVGSCCSSPGSSLEEEPLLQLNASARDITSTSLMADSSGHHNQNPGHERILYCSHNSCHLYPFSLSIFLFSLSLSLSLSLPLTFFSPFSSVFFFSSIIPSPQLSLCQDHKLTVTQCLKHSGSWVSEKCKLRIVFELQKKTEQMESVNCCCLLFCRCQVHLHLLLLLLLLRRRRSTLDLLFLVVHVLFVVCVVLFVVPTESLQVASRHIVCC